jgi:CRP-like cAMP-binding protein
MLPGIARRLLIRSPLAAVTGLLGRAYLASQRRVQTAISADAETKYREFVQTYPQLALRVPLRMIASYLGLSAETLSRIRGLNAK